LWSARLVGRRRTSGWVSAMCVGSATVTHPNPEIPLLVRAAYDSAVVDMVKRTPLMEPFTPTPLERAARAVEARWERGRKIELMRSLGFGGTDGEALRAYDTIRADVPPSGCSCDLCVPYPDPNG
jgi:hypothetical protein